MRIVQTITNAEPTDPSVFTAYALSQPHIAKPGIYRVVSDTSNAKDRFVVLGNFVAHRTVLYVPHNPSEAKNTAGAAEHAWAGAQFIRCDAGETVSLTFTQE